MNNLTVDPLLNKLQIELADRILHFAAFIDSSFGQGNGSIGNRLVELMQNKDISVYSEDPDQIEINKYRIGRALPFFYNYAYHARCVQGLDWEDDEWRVDSLDQVFREFLEITDNYGIVTSTGNSPSWGSRKTSCRSESFWESSPLWEMVKLCDARHALDFEEEITASDIAILAGMNEKSVRNALRAEGEHQLHSDDGDIVESAEALRWLSLRKSGFRETVFVTFNQEKLPESLAYMEIAPFIKSRLEKLYGDMNWIEKPSKLLGYSYEQMWLIVDDIEKIPIKDVQRIAKVIKVDHAWFTEQIFTALFPEQMQLILYKKNIEYTIITDELDKPFIEVHLTEKGIKNGYIDIPAKLTDFFPKDCFGDRSKDELGASIELRFGNEVRSTDMRVKSSITISPRARFGGYFNKVINAKPGDTLRIIKVDDRVFEIKHNPSL